MCAQRRRPRPQLQHPGLPSEPHRGDLPDRFRDDLRPPVDQTPPTTGACHTPSAIPATATPNGTGPRPSPRRSGFFRSRAAGLAGRVVSVESCSEFLEIGVGERPCSPDSVAPFSRAARVGAAQTAGMTGRHRTRPQVTAVAPGPAALPQPVPPGRARRPTPLPGPVRGERMAVAGRRIPQGAGPRSAISAQGSGTTTPNQPLITNNSGTTFFALR
jgi:hypothetical protein